MSTPSPVPPAPASIAPVVVTFRQVQSILTGQEAVGQIQEAANRDAEAPPLEQPVRKVSPNE